MIYDTNKMKAAQVVSLVIKTRDSTRGKVLTFTLPIRMFCNLEIVDKYLSYLAKKRELNIICFNDTSIILLVSSTMYASLIIRNI